MQLVKQGRIGKETLKIYIDESAESPREWDNLGKMVCFHRRYSMPQEGERKFENPEDFDEWLNEIKHKVVILPIFMLEHGQIALRTHDFRDMGYYGRFDSGQLGYIYATLADIRKEYSVKRVTRKLKEKVERVLRAEVDVFSQYLNGEVYGYRLIESGKEKDSCWSFYGYDMEKNGILDAVGKKWKDKLENVT